MIDALAGCVQEEYTGKLFSVVDHLRSPPDMPTWFPKTVDWTACFPVSDDLKDRVLTEIRRKAGLSPDDHSPLAARTILAFVTDEYLKAVLANGAGQEAEERMGHRGILLEHRYRVRFAAAFESAAHMFCIERYPAQQAVNDPHCCKHFPPSHVPGVPSLSLSVWPRKRRLSPGECYYLVQTQRQGAEQTVTDAWRIYFSDLFPRLSGVRTPMQLWRQFALTYGHPLQAGDKTFEYIEQEQLTSPLQSLDPLRYRLSGLLRPSPQGEDCQEVLLCFALDLEKYCRALRKRGVPSSLCSPCLCGNPGLRGLMAPP